MNFFVSENLLRLEVVDSEHYLTFNFKQGTAFVSFAAKHRVVDNKINLDIFLSLTFVPVVALHIKMALVCRFSLGCTSFCCTTIRFSFSCTSFCCTTIRFRQFYFRLLYSALFCGYSCKASLFSAFCFTALNSSNCILAFCFYLL